MKYPENYLSENISNKADALQMIIDIAADYDGIRGSHELWDLVDELVAVANTGLSREV